MAQVDSENSIAMPIAPTSGAGPAKQQRDREKTQKRLAKLRAKASDEIERLLSFLDASDPYAATELEDSIDDEACDTNELEPSLGWTSTEAKSGRVASPADVDMEGDAREDDEPSLGSLGSCDGDQSRWGEGGRADLEEQCEDEGGEHDGREPDHDDEPSLCGLGAHERQGFGNDYDGELEPYPDEKNLEARRDRFWKGRHGGLLMPDGTPATLAKIRAPAKATVT